MTDQDLQENVQDVQITEAVVPRLKTRIKRTYVFRRLSPIIHKARALTMSNSTTPPGQYQSVAGKAGSSRSEEKWKAMKVKSAEDKRVLDLGCNEGFFIEKFLELGASHAVGVDKDKVLLKRARKRIRAAKFEDVEWKFVDSDWDSFLDTQPDDSFDIIIMLSALHYAPNYHEILRKINRVLAPDGVFYLEASVSTQQSNLLIPIERGSGSSADTVYHFTGRSLNRIISDQFTVRYLNRSVDQPGDPIARHMYKLTPRLRTCMLVTGDSASGKTTLSRRIEPAGFTHVELDVLLKDLMVSQFTSLGRELAEHFNKRQLNKAYEFLLENEDRREKFLKYLMRNFSDLQDVVVEGVILNDESFRQELIDSLMKNGFYIKTLSL